MDREQARVEAKRRIEEYLQQRGIDTRKEFPCLNPEHNDREPSMSLDRKHNIVHCFACKASYDIFDLVRLEYGLDSRAAFEKAYELLGIRVDENQSRSKSKAREGGSGMSGQNHDKTGQDTQPHTQPHTHTHTQPGEDNTGYYKACMSRIGATDYPQRRGLSAETLERHWIGFEPEFRTRDGEDKSRFVSWRAIIIPTGRYSYTVRNTDPEAGKKNRYRNRGNAQLFNAQILQKATRPVYVVEGEIDAMSIEEAGGEALGLGSLDNAELLLRTLENKRPSQPLIIALDVEEESKQATVDSAEKLLTDGLERLHLTYIVYKPYVGYHDANEALCRDRAAFVEAVSEGTKRVEDAVKQAEEAELEEYLTTSAGANLQSFIDGITESVNTPCLPTGFETLDRVIDGGLYEGLITIGAISSLGKTSLVLQIADQIAKAGTDVLIFSLEMARAELMSKSISRHTLQLALAEEKDSRSAKTARGITDGKRYINYSLLERKLIQDAISAYGEYASRLFIQEGVGTIGTAEIRETVEKHIRLTGRRPLVIVDYLQIVAPYSDRATDKQVVDNCVLELKRMSRDCKIPVIAISSFNRAGYKLEATFEQLKESGAIEYGSDIVIGLQLKGAGDKNFDPTAEKKRNPRQVELVILKNRQGKVGDKILFDYYPMFNYFVDKGLSE